jgi:iron complex outermembrane recepter protein
MIMEPTLALALERRNSLSIVSQSLLSTAAAAALVAAALLGSPARAQQAPSSSSSSNGELQEVVVTGSLIRRSDTELPSPVQIITSADITDSGYSSITDILRNLPSNGQGALSQSFGQAFGAGGSGVALRGLTVGATLTLIDNERMVAYPLNDDNQRSFVDVSAIPIDAIDTVEVLKDNASAIYGSDAIAGVVNFRLKKSYTGANITAEAGTTQHGDGTTEHIAGIAGFGDLDADGHNFYVAIDLRHVDDILSTNRSAAFTQLDWSGLPDGVNTMLGAPGSPNLGGYPRSNTGYLLNPYTSGYNTSNPADAGMPATYYLPGCTAALQAANKCTYAFPGQIQPPTRQADVLARFSQKLADDWTFVATGSVFDSASQQVAPPFPPGNDCCNNTSFVQGGVTTVGFGPGVAPHVTSFPITVVPAGVLGNPYGVAAPLIYTYANDVGPLTTYIDTVTYRFMADVQGKVAGWNVTIDAGAMYSSTSVEQLGDIEPANINAYIANGTYVPGVTKDAAALFAPPAEYHPSSTLDIVDVHASRDLFDLPGGKVAFGGGYQYFHKATNSDPGASIPSQVTGQQTGDPAFTIGAQDDNAAFAELDTTAFDQLEVNAAGRFDHYDTYGSSVTPKLGVKWTPIKMLTLRGTWGRGFRAPSTSEAGNSGETFGAGQFQDPTLCKNGLNAVGSYNATCAFSLVGYQPSNPDLKAVKSLNQTAGFIFEPSQNFNASVDWWGIRLTDDIISQFEAGGLNGYTSLVRGAYATLQPCIGPATTPGGTCAQGPAQSVQLIAFANYPYVNAGITQTEGIDFDFRSKFDIGDFGTIKAELAYTHVIEYDLTVAGTTYQLAGTHGPAGISGDTGNPKDRAQLSLTWAKGGATVTVTENWIGPFEITDPSSGLSNCATSLAFYGPTAYAPRYTGSITGAPPSQWNQYCTVQRYFETNLYASYAVDEHLSFHGSILNVANNLPPVDLNTYGGGGQLAYDGSFYQDGAVGRFFMAGATYKF